MSVTVGVYPKKPKTSKLEYPKPDVDNYAKAVLDACNALVWIDDSQIIELEVHKSWSKADGYFTLTIKEYK
jgi:Holliday junction resolvase RusA-like endonuclease